MKIVVYMTLQEASDKLKDALNADEIVIEQNPQIPYAEAILRVTRCWFPNTYTGSDKIPAIKKLRELVAGLGLAEAKVAVERPDEAINFFLKYGKPMTYSN